MKQLSIDDISIKQMKMFLTVADHKSFSEAADSLFVNQSVISRTIQGMENALNVVLFKRLRHGVELTGQGQELYRELKLFISNYEKMIVKIRSGKEITKDTILVGVLDHEDPITLTKNLFRLYIKDRPEANFELRPYGWRELHDFMICEEMHCGFSFKLGIGTMPGVSTFDVVKLSSYFCVNINNAGIRDHSFDPTVLKDETIILTSVVDLVSPEERALGVCRKYGFSPKAIRYVSTMQEAQIAVKNAEGFTIDGKSFRDPYPDDIQVFPIRGLVHEQYLISLQKTDLKHQPTLDFLQWIKESRFKESDLRQLM